MVKYKKENVIKEVHTLDEISCDFCGKTIHGVEEALSCDITELKIHFGYGSRFDNEVDNLCICDKCYIKHIKSKAKYKTYEGADDE